MSGSRDDSSANSRFACSTSPSVAVGRQAPPPTDGSEVSCVAPVSARQHLRGILKALYHLLIFLNRQNYRYGLSIASNDLGLCVRCFHPRVDLVARKGLTENYRIILDIPSSLRRGCQSHYASRVRSQTRERLDPPSLILARQAERGGYRITFSRKLPSFF